MVQNLHTCFLSPRYQVVFDGKFDTSFNDGSADENFHTIYNDLFDNSLDWCTEKEYDGDGNIRYQSTPLDEVWLSEPEAQDHREAFKNIYIDMKYKNVA